MSVNLTEPLSRGIVTISHRSTATPQTNNVAHPASATPASEVGNIAPEMVYRGLGDGTGELTELGRELYETDRPYCEAMVHNAQYAVSRKYPGIYQQNVSPARELPPGKAPIAAPQIDADGAALATLKGMGMTLENVFGPKSKGAVINNMAMKNAPFYASLRRVAVRQGLLRK